MPSVARARRMGWFFCAGSYEWHAQLARRMGRSSCPKARNSMPFSERCCAFRILYHCPMYYVYLLHSAADLSRTYVGFTEDLRQRLRDHDAGKSTHTANTFRGFSSPTSHSRTCASLDFERYLRRLPVSHSPANAYERVIGAATVHLRQVRTNDRIPTLIHQSVRRPMRYFSPRFRIASLALEQSEFLNKIGGLPWGLRADHGPDAADNRKNYSPSFAVSHADCRRRVLIPAPSMEHGGSQQSWASNFSGCPQHRGQWSARRPQGNPPILFKTRFAPMRETRS